MLARSLTGGGKSSNGGLHISSRTSKRCPLRLGQWVQGCLAQAHGTGSSILSDNAPAMVLWEPMMMNTNRYQWTGCLWMDVG